MIELKGSMVAIVTPFKDGKVDTKTLKNLVNFHIANGTQAIVPCGTTGESATMSHEEHHTVVDCVVQAAKGRVKVIAGSGSNNTKEAIALTKHAKRAGADATLVINPYYNKPTQTGLYEHFIAISDAVNIPIVLYNIASRTGVNMLPETMIKIARKSKNVIAVKEASGDLNQMARIIEIAPKNFSLISGDDALLLPILALGGKGVISVLANILPAQVQAVCALYEKGDLASAKKMYYKLLPLVRAMFIETNPIPLKGAMEILGMIDGEIRLPMTQISKANKQLLKQELAKSGFFKKK